MIDSLTRFLLGAGLGSIAAGLTLAVVQTPPWWWLVGLVVACLVWFGRQVVDLVWLLVD